MSKESTFKPKKREVLGVIVLFLMVGGMTVPKVTGTQELFDKPFAFTEELSLQQEVDHYYYENVRFPTKYQPTVGYPSEINLNLLGKLSSIEGKHYVVDSFGKVYTLKDSFMPPAKVEKVVDSKGQEFVRWTAVPDADGYTIYRAKGGNSQLMDKAFGKVASSIRNLSNKGEEVVSLSKEKFSKDGEDFIFPLVKLNEGEIYVISAFSKELGETPGVTIGYQAEK